MVNALVAFVLLLTIAGAVALSPLDGSYIGRTDNEVLTLQFKFDAPTGTVNFTMIDFNTPFDPCTSISYGTYEKSFGKGSMQKEYVVYWPEVNSEGFTCMMTQLQEMWMTNFTLTSKTDLTTLKLQVGFFSMVLKLD